VTILNISLAVAPILTVVFGTIFMLTARGKKENAPLRYNALRAATIIFAVLTLVLAITDYVSR
jgi:uncharacterized membrane protein